MQSASLGSSMIEIVLDDRATSVDIDALSLGRFQAGPSLPIWVRQ